MRIAIVSTPFVKVPPSGYGGTELFCGVMADGLVRRGHEVTLFATGDSRPGCPLRALYVRAQWPPTAADEVNHAAWALAEVAKDGRYDIVHLSSPHAVPMSRFSPVHIVHTIHHARDEALSRIYTAHPDVTFVAVSRRQLEREVPLPRASAIHHGLPPAAYRPSASDEGYLAHLGRYAAEKGTALAIDAACRADLPIRLAGRPHPGDEGYYAEEIAPRLERPGVASLGELDHAGKVALLRGARALLCPLRWEEPFGLAAIEAMLCGTPVVGFPRGAFPEIVDEGVTGFLVPDGEVAPMAKVLASLAGFDRLACARRARERFSDDRMVGAYEAVYEAAARRPRHRTAA